MKGIVLTLLLLLIKVGLAQDLEFIDNDWVLAKEVSKISNRPIFAFATIKGCAPCVEMEKKVFSDSAVKSLLENNFVTLKINGQLGQGSDFVRENSIFYYPTLLYFDSSTALISINRNALNKEDFVQLCSLALNPKTRIPALIRRFQSQKVDSVFLKNYIKVLSAAGINTGPAIDSLFRIKKWKFSTQYLGYLNSCNSRYLDFIIENRKKNIHIMDAASSIDGVYYTTAQRIFNFGEFSEFEYAALKEKIIKSKIYGWEEKVDDLEKIYVKFRKEHE